jgi:ribosomal protein L37AE/L43A
MTQTINLTIIIEDDCECPDCKRSFDIDVDEIAVCIGECPDCGANLWLEPDENGIKWGQVQ